MADKFMLISIEDAEYFDLFDNIEYKYVKDIMKEIHIPIRIYVSSEDDNDNAIVEFETALDTRYTCKYWKVERYFRWKSPYGDKVQRLVTEFSILNDF